MKRTRSARQTIRQARHMPDAPAIDSPPMLSILAAINSPHIFAPAFASNPGSWHAWFTFAAVVFGENESLDEDDLALFRECTGRETPRGPYRTVHLCCGRRGGKSYISGLIAVYLAAFKDYRPYLAAGQRAMIVIVCPDRDQSANLLRFIGGMFDDSPTLGKLIERRDRDSFELSTRCTITIMTASFRTIRGYVISCAILDELAYMPGDDAALPATELIRSIKPALGDIPGSMLICASSPKGKNGPLWDAYTAHFGREDSRELFWKAPTLTMRPTFDEQIVREAVEDDPVGALGEYFAEFSDDVSSCFSRAAVEDAVDPGCYERPPADFTYQAFVDVSGGTGKDSFTMAIAHIERQDGVDVAVLDVLFEARPPFKPDLIVRDCCRILSDYGVSRIIGDRYAAAWPPNVFDRHHVRYEPSEKFASDIYLSSIRHFNSGLVRLLDNRRLVSQICALERKQQQGGREKVFHPRAGHDDLANAALGVLDLCLSENSGQQWIDFGNNVHKLNERMYGHV
jgi:hypothetical protein